MIHKAKIRDIKFEITLAQAWDKFCEQDKKCALTGLPLTFARNYDNAITQQSASLDRINSAGDYTLDNIQWVHKTVNMMKRDLDQQEFLYFCKLLIENGKENKNSNDHDNSSHNDK